MRLGQVWLGAAWPGEARFGRLGRFRWVQVRCGGVRPGKARQVWSGKDRGARHGEVR